MSRLALLIRYMSNVFHLPHLVKRVTDSRDKARVQIQTGSVLLAWMLGFSARIRSREELGRLLDNPAVQRLVDGHVSSDTLARVLGQIDSDSLRSELLVPVVREIRRNKAWKGGSVQTQLLVGIDGSQAFCTQRQSCSGCSSRQLPSKNDDQSPITEYHHQAAFAFVLGTNPRIYLDVEPVLPGESEVTAGTRLVKRLAQNFGRWIDGIVADHRFAGAPFLNHARSAGFHYIVRVKDEERRLLTRDAARLFAECKPTAEWTERIGHHTLQVVSWDAEGFTSWKGLNDPVRVVVCDESESAQEPAGRRKTARPERQRSRSFFATSYDEFSFPAHAIWLAYHRRWDIENHGIRQLKHEWHWDHPFVHTPQALINLWLLMVVAANLFVAFVYRRLHVRDRDASPARAIAQEIAAALVLLTVADVPTWNSS